MKSTLAILLTSSGATAIAAIAMAALLVLLRARLRRDLPRALCTVGVVLTVLLAPGLVDFFVVHLNAAFGRARWIDPGLLSLWSPSLLALVAAMAVSRWSEKPMPAN